MLKWVSAVRRYAVPTLRCHATTTSRERAMDTQVLPTHITARTRHRLVYMKTRYPFGDKPATKLCTDPEINGGSGVCH